jgi:hypothetical protein
MALASRATALASRAAVRISVKTSSRLLLAAPSVPRHRFTPAARSASIGAKPLASFRLEDGQCATEQPFARQELDFSLLQVDGVHGDQPRTQQAESAQPLERPHAMLGERALDLVLGLVEMHVHR